MNPTAPPSAPALRAALEVITPLTDTAWVAVAALLQRRRISPGEHLLRAGEKALRVAFIESGLVREYYLDDAGRESTRRFCHEGELCGSLVDLLQGGPASVSIQALEPCLIWELDWAGFDALTEIHPCLMKLMRRVAEGLYVRKTQREFDMLTLPAAERYRRFVQAYPALDARLPRHMVASYLGITPVHLSRICVADKSR